MMFLEALARYITEKDKGNPAGRCFVFPNRRSGLFFKRFLVKHSPATQWSPRIVTINELMTELSGYQQADPLDMLFTLHEIYAVKAPFPEPFDSFYAWGEMMISDFDTLDKYLVDPDAIFRNIRELKEIDESFGGLEEEQVEFIRKFWKSFHQGEVTKEKELFLATWKMLPELYHALKEHLAEKGEGYEGMVYRAVAETDMAELYERLTDEHYYFIGFNALSKSEKMLFGKLQKRGIASFFWDYDEEYIKDTSMEAGRFLRENIVQFPPPADLGIFNNLRKKREIRIFDLPSDILQAKTIHKLLSGRDSTITGANDTAIVACDENLLMPVLVSLPEQVDLVNITMGYPFSNTPLFSFVESILKLYRNKRISKSGTFGFYNKDVLSVLNHQYFKLISDENPATLAEKIVYENRVYVEPAFFSGGFASVVFLEVTSVEQLCRYLDELLRYILGRLLNEEEHQYRELEKEYILVVQGRLNKLSQIIQEKQELEPETFMRLFRRIMWNQRIPFTGEPLAGLQVMGILETRLLDFENVIMLSVNEEVMPKSAAGNSFIPWSMRYAYGLPVQEDMDAIYAYYFYRIIQRAGKVDLLFKSAAGGVRSGEMSRYLYQVRYDYDAKIIRPVMPLSASGKRAVRIEKTPEILAVMDKYMEGADGDRYLSPSALNTYIECSLKFYFRKILQVQEQEELLEELDAIGFGNILHKTIHLLYMKLSSNRSQITREEILGLSSGNLIDRTLEEVFIREYFRTGKERSIEGRNLIILAILKKYLLKIIETDAGVAPLELVDMEEDYRMVKEITTATGRISVRLGGKIDRVDRPEGDMTRIIDYKTGGSDLKFDSIASLFDREQKSRNKEAFQAFVYASLYLHQYPEDPVHPGLYVVRKMFGENYSTRFMMGGPGKKEPVLSFNEYAVEFNERLIALLTEIYDPEVPFVQTEITDYCKYCDFKGICDRE